MGVAKGTLMFPSQHYFLYRLELLIFIAKSECMSSPLTQVASSCSGRRSLQEAMASQYAENWLRMFSSYIFQL